MKITESKFQLFRVFLFGSPNCFQMHRMSKKNEYDYNIKTVPVKIFNKLTKIINMYFESFQKKKQSRSATALREFPTTSSGKLLIKKTSTTT